MPEINIQQRSGDDEWAARNVWRTDPIVERFADPDAIASATTRELQEARGTLVRYGDSRGVHRELVDAINAEDGARADRHYRKGMQLIDARHRAQTEWITADYLAGRVAELAQERPHMTMSELVDELRREADEARELMETAIAEFKQHQNEDPS